MRLLLIAALLAASAPLAAQGHSARADTAVADSFDVAPVLINPGEVHQVMRRVYPPLLRDAGVGGVVRLSFVIGLDGRVIPGSIRLFRSDNHDFDRGAREMALTMRFIPAQKNGQPVRARMRGVPMTFEP